MADSNGKDEEKREEKKEKSSDGLTSLAVAVGAFAVFFGGFYAKSQYDNEQTKKLEKEVVQTVHDKDQNLETNLNRLIKIVRERGNRLSTVATENIIWCVNLRLTYKFFEVRNSNAANTKNQIYLV